MKLDDYILITEEGKVFPSFTYDSFHHDEDGNVIYEGLVITKTAQEWYDEILYNRENPQPSEPTAEEQVQNLQEENKLLKAQVEALNGVTDFHEELIVEMANKVYA